jgi:hypothetical protein
LESSEREPDGGPGFWLGVESELIGYAIKATIDRQPHAIPFAVAAQPNLDALVPTQVKPMRDGSNGGEPTAAIQGNIACEHAHAGRLHLETAARDATHHYVVYDLPGAGRIAEIEEGQSASSHVPILRHAG